VKKEPTDDTNKGVYSLFD